MAKKAKEKQRLDASLVARGLADNLAEARGLIMAGKVVAGDQRLDKPGSLVAAGVPLRVKDGARYVSRGGDKLAAALAELDLGDAVRDAVVLDVGASTGGFTQCCLELGARHVLALDVGTCQLAWELRQDPRVTSLERTDVRAFEPAAYPAVTMVVADVSFNSLARLAPALRRAAPHGGVHFLVLVKPQFELDRDEVPPGGVVTDDAARAEAVTRVAQAFSELGLAPGRAVDSRLAGRAGNREIFWYVQAPLGP